MRSLPVVLPVLDFSTIKNELFPVVGAVFTRTNSLAIKVRGLQSFVILCGGSTDAAADDGLNGLAPQKTSSSSALDKYTMQEKIVPLVKGIKTKEPAVMMAALNVLRIVGQTADADFVAMDILPILWSMSLGPLLELKQFQTFMELIKLLSRKVEDEQTRKLQELSTSNGPSSAVKNEDFLSFGGVTGTSFEASNGATEDDFESLVKGRSSTSGAPANGGFSSWDEAPNMATTSTARSSTSTPAAPAFSWSTPTPSQPSSPPITQAGAMKSQQASFRTVTPDLNRFESLSPSSTQFSQPLQPSNTGSFSQPQQQTPASTVNWGAATQNPWGSSTPNYSSNTSTMGSMNNAMSNMSMNQQRSSMSQSSSSFSLAPPPGSNTNTTLGSSFGIQSPPSGSFGIQPPPQPQQQPSWGGMGQQQQQSSGMSMGSMMGGGMAQQQQQQRQAQQPQQPQQKSGLDKYQSLI